MHSYRCQIRHPKELPAPDAALNDFVQIKADNAVEAQRLAHLVTGCAVIDVERQDGAA